MLWRIMQPHSTEKKMELIHSIRAENQNNRGLLRKREQILFGKALPELRALEDNPVKNTLSYNIPNFSSFKIRLFIAILLFTCFVIMDIGNMSYFEIGATQIQQFINETIELPFLN